MRKIAVTLAFTILSSSALAQVMGPAFGPIMNIPGPGLPGYAAYGIAGALSNNGPAYGYGNSGGYGPDVSTELLGGVLPGVGGAYSTYNTQSAPVVVQSPTVVVRRSPRVAREVVIAKRARPVSCPTGMIPQPQPIYDQWGGWMGTLTICY